MKSPENLIGENNILQTDLDDTTLEKLVSTIIIEHKASKRSKNPNTFTSGTIEFEKHYQKVRDILLKTKDTGQSQEGELIDVLNRNLMNSHSFLECLINYSVKPFMDNPEDLILEKQITDLQEKFRQLTTQISIIHKITSLAYDLKAGEVSAITIDPKKFGEHIDKKIIANEQMPIINKMLRLIGAAYNLICSRLNNITVPLAFIELRGIEYFKEPKGQENLQKIYDTSMFILKQLEKITNFYHKNFHQISSSNSTERVTREIENIRGKMEPDL